MRCWSADHWALYLIFSVLALKGAVDQATVDGRNQRVGFNMGRKVKISVRFPDTPLFLEFGGRFSVVWRGEKLCG